MIIQEVPLNGFPGLQPSTRYGFILELANNGHLSNLLGTIHAGGIGVSVIFME